MKQYRVDIATFQEATPLHLEELMASEYLREHFYMNDFTNQTSTYRTLVVSRFPPAKLTTLDIPYSPRKITIGRFNMAGKQTLAVSSVHQQSEEDALNARRVQLEFLNEKLQQVDYPIIEGDFNFHKKQEDEIFKRLGMADVWNKMRKGDPGFTFDTVTNPMAAMTAGIGFRHRLDRVLVPKKRTMRRQLFSVQSIEIVGQKCIEPETLCISDYYGLLVSLVARG